MALNLSPDMAGFMTEFGYANRGPERGVNRLTGRRISPEKAHGLWIFAVYRADMRSLKTVNFGSVLNFGADCVCLVRILGPKPNLDHRSFFSLGRFVNEFIQNISLSNKAH